MSAVRQVSIRGRVQGVGYRAWLVDEAESRALDGWVRNRRDGSVEAVFAGPDEVVADMIAACRRGPPMARVEAIDQHDAGRDQLALRPAGERFAILATI